MFQNHLVRNSLVGVAAVLAITLSNGISGAQTSAYYIAAGDQSATFVVQNGVLINRFSSFRSGYGIAVTNTIWLGDRDDRGAAEYTLGGTATGNTSSGGNRFSQLLDGTTDGKGKNYGAVYSQNRVTVGNSDWSNQNSLFADNSNGTFESIAYDTLNDHLFVGTFEGDLLEFDLLGNLLASSFQGTDLASLAYEQATDTLWVAPNESNQIVQLSTTGSFLQSITVEGVDSFRNNYGGEFAVAPAFATSSVPEPGSIALLMGLVSTGGLFAFKRRRAAKNK